MTIKTTYGQRRNTEKVPANIARYSHGAASWNARLAEMRHEIRNPLHVVMGLTSVLAASAPLTEKQQEIIKMLDANTQSLHLLIENLFKIIETKDRRFRS